MKHQDFYLDYSEVMYKERDVIQQFLDDTADIQFGNQMYEYALDEIEVIAQNGAIYYCYEIFRDKDAFVKFRVKNTDEHHEVWEAHNFAYGELSKIIDKLPEPSEYIQKYVNDDMYRWTKECSVSLEENPYIWRDGESVFEVRTIYYDKTEKKVGYEVKEMINSSGVVSSGWGLWSELPANVAKELRAHVSSEILRRDDRYKTLKEQLSRFGGNLYNFVENGNVGAVTIKYLRGTDLQLPVLDVSFESGHLAILVSVAGTRIADETEDDTFLLTENDLDPEDLESLVDFFNEPDVMDCYNGHNKELVEKINKAWHTIECRFSFKLIVFALATRYEEEYETKIGDRIPTKADDVDYGVAHNLLENVCDDEDLEIILKFLRYE